MLLRACLWLPIGFILHCFCTMLTAFQNFSYNCFLVFASIIREDGVSVLFTLYLAQFCPLQRFHWMIVPFVIIWRIFLLFLNIFQILVLLTGLWSPVEQTPLLIALLWCLVDILYFIFIYCPCFNVWAFIFVYCLFLCLISPKIALFDISGFINLVNLVHK